MKTKFLFGAALGFVALLLIAATTTEVNIANLPSAASLASTNAVLVLTNATKARLGTIQQILDVLNSQTNLNVAVSNITASQMTVSAGTNSHNALIAYYQPQAPPGGAKAIYWGGTSVALAGEGGASSGESVGVLGVTDFSANDVLNYGVVGLTPVAGKSGQTNVAVAGSTDQASSIAVGGYFEIASGYINRTNPVFESSVLLLDNRDSGLPLITARTNNGTTVFKLNADGSLSLSGQTNKIADSGTAAIFNGSPLALQSAVDGKQATLTATTAIVGTNGVFGATVNATNGYLKGALTGITTTNTFYSVTADLTATVTNVVTVSGGIITSWIITQ
jgi:hypothetical protein